MELRAVMAMALAATVNTVMDKSRTAGTMYKVDVKCTKDEVEVRRTLWRFHHKEKNACLYSLALSEQAAWGALRLSLTQPPSSFSGRRRRHAWDQIRALGLSQELETSNIQDRWVLTPCECRSTAEAVAIIKETMDNPGECAVLNVKPRPRSLKGGTPSGRRILSFTVDVVQEPSPEEP